MKPIIPNVAENYLEGHKPGSMTSYQGTARFMFPKNPMQTQGPGRFLRSLPYSFPTGRVNKPEMSFFPFPIATFNGSESIVPKSANDLVAKGKRELDNFANMSGSLELPWHSSELS